MDTLRVILVDDDPMWLALTSALADTDETIEIVARVSTGADTLAAATENQPSVILLDLAMPDIDGLSLLPEILETAPDCRVVVVTGNDYAPLREMAIEAGAIGLLAKNPLETLFDRLRVCMNSPAA